MAESWDSVEMFLALRLEIEMFMNEKGKFVTELGDKSDFRFWHSYVLSATT
jgi:hypothetical protein